MTVLWILAAAAAAGSPLLRQPVPTAPVQDWLAANDYPAGPAGGPTTRALNFALTISAEGNVVKCLVEATTGLAALDAKACQLLEQRGKFTPALDNSGVPVVGVYRDRAIWATAGSSPAALPLVEMAVALQAMPGTLPDPAYLDLAVSTDATGKADGCVVVDPIDIAGKPIAAKIEAGKILGATACGEALRTMKLEPAKSPSGEAVRSVQIARALFTARPAQLAAKPTDQGIRVKGRRIDGKTEVNIPYRGVNPVIDISPSGYEEVLLESQAGLWYRARLAPPCIGSSQMIKFSKEGAQIEVEQDLIDRLPRDLRRAIEDQPGYTKILPPNMMINESMAFSTNADGSFDRRSGVIVQVIDPLDVVQIKRCQITSLVASDPPNKPRKKPAK